MPRPYIYAYEELKFDERGELCVAIYADEDLLAHAVDAQSAKVLLRLINRGLEAEQLERASWP